MRGLTAPTATDVVRVGDVAEQVRGVSYSKADVRTVPEPGYVPLLRGGNVREHGLVFDDLQYVPGDGVSKKQILRAGDIVVVASSGSLSGVGKAASVPSGFHGTFGAFCKVIRPTDKIDASFLGHYFRTADYRSRVSSMAGGANINNLRNEHLDGLKIRLPALREQRRIAAVLDKADDLRSKRRQALAHLDALTQSIFDASTQELWEKDAVPLAELCESIQTGPFGSLLHREDYVQDGVPLINPMHIWSGHLHPSPDYSVTSNKFDELRSYHLRVDDIVIARRGEMGRCALVIAAQLPLLCGTGSMIVRPDSQAVSPRYLQQVLSSSAIRHRLEDVSQGVTMSNLNGKILSNLKVRVPTLARQRKLTNKYEAIEQLRLSHRVQLDSFDVLFGSLQNRAFKAGL